MIAIDMPNVGKWAENNQIPYTTFTDISQKEETYDLIAQEVAKTNESLPKVAKVKKVAKKRRGRKAKTVRKATRTRAKGTCEIIVSGNLDIGLIQTFVADIKAGRDVQMRRFLLAGALDDEVRESVQRLQRLAICRVELSVRARRRFLRGDLLLANGRGRGRFLANHLFLRRAGGPLRDFLSDLLLGSHLRKFPAA